MPTQTTGEESDALSVYISAGVSATVVVLVTTAVTVITVSVCLRKRKNKHVNTTDNVAYHDGSGEEMMQVNDTYASVDAISPTNNNELLTSVNDAYLAMHELELNEECQYAYVI